MNTSQENWKLPENSYQLPYDILEVANELNTLRIESKQEKITIIADTYICNMIRQYDANICLPFSSYDFADVHGKKRDIPYLMCMLMDNQDNIDAGAIQKILEENHIDYLVININNNVSLSYMQEIYWQIVATTSTYHILQYQEPVFTTDPLSAAGLDIEQVEVVIPGLTEECHLLCLTDLHIITENDEITTAELENIRSRQYWSSISEDVTAAEYWTGLPDILDSCNADGILFGGDMIDFCSSSNVECLKQGLNRLVTPHLYVRADHDLNPYWCEGITGEQCNLLHSDIDGNEEVRYMELPELCVVGLNNNTAQITESGLERMKEIFSIGKPIILLTHVSYDSLLDSSLQEASKAAWQDRALVWGKDCIYQPDVYTKEFMDMVYADDSPVKEILCGHLHFSWDGYITENTHEHVFSPAFTKTVGVITVKGE